MNIQQLLYEKDGGFRLRGMRTTRFETFLDAAFAFATTMLIISIGDIPHTYTELVTALKGIPAFAASFATVLSFWMAHRKWSRRYGLEDFKSILISLAMVFILLVYVYPLKLMFSALFAWISHGWVPSEFSLSNLNELIHLFIIYGLGFAAMAFTFVLLYSRALNSDYLIPLDDVEKLLTRYEITSFVVLAATGLLSALLAAVLPINVAAIAGFVYVTLPVSIPIVSVIYKRKRDRLEQ